MKNIIFLKKNLFFVIIFLIGGGGLSFGQTTVTFNVNLKPQLKDSIFVPERGDLLEIAGDILPLGMNKKMQLKDLEPVDSVFTIKITFPYRNQGRQLSYYFVLTTENETQKEDMPHIIRLSGRNIETDPLYFNAYAW